MVCEDTDHGGMADSRQLTAHCHRIPASIAYTMGVSRDTVGNVCALTYRRVPGWSVRTQTMVAWLIADS